MISDVAAYLRYFDSVHRRTLRDVAALPAQAAAWQPPPMVGEAGWDIGTLVIHIAATRLYFASAYRGEGWLLPELGIECRDQGAWIPILESSAAEFRRRLESTPHAWLQRRIPLVDTPGSVTAWRLLLMMVEHEVHHRSQIDTYAGLEGWPVPQIFDRTYEAISALQAEERAKHQA